MREENGNLVKTHIKSLYGTSELGTLAITPSKESIPHDGKIFHQDDTHKHKSICMLHPWFQYLISLEILNQKEINLQKTRFIRKFRESVENKGNASGRGIPSINNYCITIFSLSPPCSSQNSLRLFCCFNHVFSNA